MFQEKKKRYSATFSQEHEVNSHLDVVNLHEEQLRVSLPQEAQDQFCFLSLGPELQLATQATFGYNPPETPNLNNSGFTLTLLLIWPFPWVSAGPSHSFCSHTVTVPQPSPTKSKETTWTALLRHQQGALLLLHPNLSPPFAWSPAQLEEKGISSWLEYASAKQS